VPAMRAMFPQVESLLLVNPASSATAERSFFCLRRLMNYMHTTCGQQRLNNIALCHIHKHIMDAIDVNELMKEFVLVLEIIELLSLDKSSKLIVNTSIA